MNLHTIIGQVKQEKCVVKKQQEYFEDYFEGSLDFFGLVFYPTAMVQQYPIFFFLSLSLSLSLSLFLSLSL